MHFFTTLEVVVSCEHLMKEIKTNINCDIIHSGCSWMFAFAASLPLFIFASYRHFVISQNPDMDHVIPANILLAIMAGSICILFVLFRHLLVIYYIYSVLKQISCTGTDTLYLTDIESLFDCKESKAKKIIKKIIDGGFFPELYYDPIGGVLIFSQEKAVTYEETVTGTNGQRLTPKVIQSRKDISRIQSASDELKKAIQEYEESMEKDKRVRKAMYSVIESLDKIPQAMTYNMANNIDVHKVYTYYVPTLCSLIHNYCNYSNASVTDTGQLRKRLIDTLTSTDDMFNKICISIYANDELDLDVEMSTLQAVMSADGYGDLPIEIPEEDE